jgi:hypothetical protein
MPKKLTITIENIDDEALEGVWQQTIKTAAKHIGVEITEVDDIQLDFSILMENQPDIGSALVSGAITGHLMMETYRFFNKEAT